MPRISTFDDWVDLFRAWIQDIGVDYPEVRNYKFETKFGQLKTTEVEFGDYASRRKWEKVLEIPDQRIRDGLQNLIIYQGDTEFASVEQQRKLFDNAPSEHDRMSLVRVMTEEMRHGWQMCHLLIEHFGHSGRIEALKQLERRAFEHKRLLGAFNETVDNWLDFFTYTDFVDRDGKFQLTMLSYSAFAPLARSTVAMLKEESFHLGTGHDGLKRILKAGKIPVPILQKFINKWVTTAYDLFGVDHSSSAHWAYVWGLKGRYDEHQAQGEANKEQLNEHSRILYYLEVKNLMDQLNRNIPEDHPKLFAPDLKFNRKIGDFAHATYNAAGELLSKEKFDEYVKDALPSAADYAFLKGIFAEDGWIAPKAPTGQ